MPTPAAAQTGSASHGTPHCGATSSSAAAPPASRQNPRRNSRGRGRSGCLPCHQDVTDQPSEPTTSGVPAAASDQWCVLVRISGRYEVEVKNNAAHSPRQATTVGIPRRARNTPGGSSRWIAGASTARATTTTKAAVRLGFSPAQLNADTPAAAPNAATTSPRRFGVKARSGGVSRRIAGTTRASASTATGTNPKNTHRQENRSVTTPEIGGPISEGSTHAEDIRPNIAGRTYSGYICPTST